MRNSYYNDFGPASEHKRRSLIGYLFDGVMLAVSILTAVLTVLVAIAPMVRPAGWFFPTLALVAPAVWFVAVILALWWIIRWRWFYFAIVALPLLCSAGYFQRFVRLEIKRTADDFAVDETSKEESEPDERDESAERDGSLTRLFRRLLRKEEPRHDTDDAAVAETPKRPRRKIAKRRDRSTFSLLTYNVRQFYDANGSSSLEDVMQLICEADPDIVCLQEFFPRTATRTVASVDSLLEGYRSVDGYGKEQAPDIQEIQQLIYTRLKVLDSGHFILADVPAASSTVWADVVAGNDTVRVINNHLLSTQINAEDDTYLTKMGYIIDTAADDRMRSIIGRFSRNSIRRADQADSLAHAIASSPHPVIVCGDFNDPPMSYTYDRISEGLQDAFCVKGKGYSHTFRGFNNVLRIDYVLLSPSFEVTEYTVEDVDYSDHLPVMVRFKPFEKTTRKTNR